MSADIVTAAENLAALLAEHRRIVRERDEEVSNHRLRPAGNEAGGRAVKEGGA